jgi:pimeloyl-ACP methyl ester carboxylesterase
MTAPADSLRVFTAADGTALAYRLWRGAAPRPLLVLLHGMASNHTRWWEFVEKTTLKERWDLLRPDLRGHGRSVYRGRLGMERWCDDLAALLAHEGYTRAVVGGHCLGANLALHFAHRHPEKTAGLVLIEPMLPAALVGNLKAARRFRTLFLAAIALIRLFNALGLYRRQLPALDLEALDRSTRAAMAAAGNSDALTRRYAAPWYDLRYNPSANYLQDLAEVSREPPPLAEIRAPALALISTGRKFAEPEPTRAGLSALPNGRIVAIAAHHWIPTERPDEMRRAIEDWCAGLGL